MIYELIRFLAHISRVFQQESYYVSIFLSKNADMFERNVLVANEIRVVH